MPHRRSDEDSAGRHTPTPTNILATLGFKVPNWLISSSFRLHCGLVASAQAAATGSRQWALSLLWINISAMVGHTCHSGTRHTSSLARQGLHRTLDKMARRSARKGVICQRFTLVVADGVGITRAYIEAPVS